MQAEIVSTTIAIQRARAVLTEAKIALRDAQRAAEDVKVELSDTFQYDEVTGKNKDTRALALSTYLSKSPDYGQAKRAVWAAEDRVDRAQTELDQWLDERRHTEQVTWAKLADYVRERADRVGYAPTQAARLVVEEAVREEVVEDIEDGDYYSDWPAGDQIPF